MPIRSREHLGSAGVSFTWFRSHAATASLLRSRARARRGTALTEEGAVDRLAAWIGRLMAFRVEPTQFGGWNWAEKLISTKDAYSTRSTLWRPRPPAQPTVVVSNAAVAIVKTTKTTLTLKPRKI
jgi:hypothetical protein